MHIKFCEKSSPLHLQILLSELRMEVGIMNWLLCQNIKRTLDMNEKQISCLIIFISSLHELLTHDFQFFQLARMQCNILQCQSVIEPKKS